MGCYRGALARVRPDDLGARTIRPRSSAPASTRTDRRCLLRRRQPVRRGQPRRGADGGAPRGPPRQGPGATVNRLCASGLEAVNAAARAVKLGEGDYYLAGGVESISRAPWVIAKPDGRFPAARRPCTTPPSAGASSTRGWRSWALDRVDGRDGRERRRALRGLARGPGRLRPTQPPARCRGRRGGPLRRRAPPGRGAGGRETVPSTPTRAPAPTPRSRSWRGCARCSARAAPSPPATPRRSTTARRAC